MIVECIKTSDSDTINLRRKYIVMGFYIKSVNKCPVIDYILYDYNIMIVGYDISYFEIIDNKLPNNWVLNKLDSDTCIISFFEFNSWRFFDNLFEGEKTELDLFKKRHKELENWYRDMEIDEFFTHAEKYGITDDEKKTMLEYYKSRPDSAEWEQDKNLLMLNVNK